MSSHIPGSELYEPPTTTETTDLLNSQLLQKSVAEAAQLQTISSTNSTATPISNMTLPDQQKQFAESFATPGEAVKQEQRAAPVTSIPTVTPTNRPTVIVPKVEIKLFVGRLPKQMAESELEPLFAQYGGVLETVIIRDKASGQHKGSAFIKMASLTDADKAIRSLHNLKVVDNQLGPIQVKYANGEAERLGLPAENSNPGVDIGKLFVGSLPRGVSEQQVRDIFEAYGTIDEVVLMKDPGTGQTKGCAFVKYAFKENAIFAIKNLNGVHHCSGCPRALEVKFAESRRTGPPSQFPTPGGPVSHGVAGSVHHPSVYGMPGMTAMVGAHRAAAPVAAPPSNLNPRSGGGWTEYFTADGRPYYHNDASKITQWTKPAEFDRVAPPAVPSAPMMPGAVGSSTDMAGPPGANVFVFHIPNEWTQNEIVQNFSAFGRVISCYIATDRTTGRNKGYGFVSFDSVDAAANAVLGMNGFLVGSKRLKVSIKNGEEAYVAHLLSPQAQAAAIQAGQMGSSPAALGSAGGGYGMGRGGQSMVSQSMTNGTYGNYAATAGTPQQPAAGAAGYGPTATAGYTNNYRPTPY